MAYITPLVINALGGGHTDTHTDARPKQFQETRRAWPLAARTPSLKVINLVGSLTNNVNSLMIYMCVVLHACPVCIVCIN